MDSSLYSDGDEIGGCNRLAVRSAAGLRGSGQGQLQDLQPELVLQVSAREGNN